MNVLESSSEMNSHLIRRRKKVREWTEKHIREVIRDELKRLMKKELNICENGQNDTLEN